MGNHTVVVNPVVADSLAAWAASELAAGRTPGTIRLRRFYLLRWAATIDGQAITAEQARSWLSWPAWAPSTRKSAVGAVRSWLRWARRAGWDVPAPEELEVPRVRRGMPRPADEAVIAAALAHAGPDDALAIKLAAELGLRRAEVAAVATTDLIGGNRLLVRGKGRRERLVPVPRDLAAELAARPPGFLFPGRIDGHKSPDAIGRRISRALGCATAHQLRHRYATTGYRTTRDIVTLSRVLGHSSIATTEVYTEPPGDALDRLAAAVVL